jgi:hypothetical protein
VNVRLGRAMAIFVVLAVVFGFGLYLARKHTDVLPTPVLAASCTVSDVKLDHEQLANAATITAVGIRRKVPDRAIVVALATSLQESKLRNLGHLGEDNDHDSLGLFQQRPSQGWGSESEIMDQRYASDSFYNALLKIRGWERLRVTDAAQSVQRSAYPEAYEKWADEAQVLASAFTGQSPMSVRCDAPSNDRAAVPSLAAQRLRQDFGSSAPPLATDQHVLTVAVADSRSGWQFAHWLVAQSDETGLTRVAFDDQQWSAEHGEWTPNPEKISYVTAEVKPAQ